MISSMSTALHNAYSTDIGARKTHTSALASEDKKKPESTLDESPTTIVNLSKEALSALEKDKASRTAAQFLRDHGKEVYESTIKDLRGYPENLAGRLSDKSLSEKELTDIQNALTEREMNAFMKYARQDPPDMKMFFKKYVEYLDTLSPEELLSQRYIGQRAVAVRHYEHFAREQGETPDDLSSAQPPITYLFEILKEIDFAVEDKNSLLKKYDYKVTTMLDREEKENLTSLSSEAIKHFNNIYSTISDAQEGNKTTLDKLQSFTRQKAITLT